MPSYTSLEAAALVISRWEAEIVAETAAYNDGFVAIDAVMKASKEMLQNDITAIVSTQEIDFPIDTPNLELFSIGLNGVPSEVELASWKLGLEREKQILEDAIDTISKDWASMGWPMPNGLLAQSVMDELEKFNEKRRVESLKLADRSMDIAMEFAKVRVTLLNLWTSSITKLKSEQNIELAKLRLQQAEVTLSGLIDKYKISTGGLRSVAEIASLLISAANAGVSAQASVHASENTVSATKSGSSREDSLSNIVIDSEVQTELKHKVRVVDEGNGTDVTTVTTGDTDVTSHTDASDPGSYKNTDSDSTSQST